jgi:hypothetical protein
LKTDEAANWALFFLVVSRLDIRYSVEFMPESAVLFFYIAALLYFVTWLSTSKRADLFLAAISTALAILVKPTSIHIGLVFAVLAVGQWGVGFLKRREVWISVGLALVPGVLWYWHAKNLYETYGNTFGLLSGGDSKFGNLATWLSPRFYLTLANLDAKWILGYGLLPVFAAGLLVILRR